MDFSLRDKLANTYNVSPLSYAAKIWNKPIFKITRRALGYTIGTKLVVSACMAAGPMGLLFGAFFLHSVYAYRKEDKEINGKSNKTANSKNSSGAKSQTQGADGMHLYDSKTGKPLYKFNPYNGKRL